MRAYNCMVETSPPLLLLLTLIHALTPIHLLLVVAIPMTVAGTVTADGEGKETAEFIESPRLNIVWVNCDTGVRGCTALTDRGEYDAVAAVSAAKEGNSLKVCCCC